LLQWTSCWRRKTIGCRNRFHSWWMRMDLCANKLTL
jgi:hypothetical protein